MKTREGLFYLLRKVEVEVNWSLHRSSEALITLSPVEAHEYLD